MKGIERFFVPLAYQGLKASEKEKELREIEKDVLGDILGIPDKTYKSMIRLGYIANISLGLVMDIFSCGMLYNSYACFSKGDAQSGALSLLLGAGSRIFTGDHFYSTEKLLSKMKNTIEHFKEVNANFNKTKKRADESAQLLD